MKSTTPLGDVIDYISGVTFAPEDKIDPCDEGAVVCFRTKNVQAELDQTDLIAVPRSVIRRSDQYVQPGDILISSANSSNIVGKCCYVGALSYVATAGGFIAIIRPRSLTHSRYLYHWLVWDHTQELIRNCARKTTSIANVDVNRLKSIPFPQTLAPEQHRIATQLDLADGIRRKRREALRLADELVRSTFLEMFGNPVGNPRGWAEAPLSSIADVSSGLAKGKAYGTTKTIFVPYMRVANVQDGHIALHDVKLIEIAESEVQRFLLEPGDVLVTEGGDPDKLGRGAVWRGEIAPCVHQNHVFRIRTDPSQLLPEFASAVLGSLRGKTYFFQAAKQTTGIASINMRQLRAFPMLAPPLHLQQSYVEKLAQLTKLRSNLTRLATTAETLFTSLQNQAFGGQA